MKRLILLACLLPLSISFNSQTLIPDDHFELALIDLGLDVGPPDGEVPTANISGITSLDVSGYFISSLAGIEDFVALETLICHSNNLTNLNLYNNTSLTNIQCFNNFISSLTLPNNSTLTVLRCGDNNLSSLDVSAYPLLEVLHCYNNSSPNLGTLDLSSNTALRDLDIHDSGVSNLNISQCNLLEKIYCYNNYNYTNPLTSLDVSGKPALTNLRCYSNNISSLDFTGSTNLNYIDCGDNPLGSIDVSSMANLETLWCWYNGLSSLDVSNNLMLQSLDCGSNSITTGNLMLPNTNSLIKLWAYYNLLTGTINTAPYTNLDLLELGGNSISSIDVSNNTLLTELWMYENNLTTVDVSNNTLLEYFDCGINNITEVDVSMLPNLVGFYCNENPNLISLDIKNGNNAILYRMWANNTNLTCIQVDDEVDANSRSTSLWRKDVTASYMENCGLSTNDKELNEVEVYPNPTTNIIAIESILDSNFSLFDVLGNRILKGEFHSGNNSLDLTSYSEGVYLLRIENHQGVTTKRIIKE